MTKRITALTDYITAQDAASLLSQKLGRPIRPGYVHKLKNVRTYRLNKTAKLYHKKDIESIVIRKKQS
jgi:hypothetical protein